MPYIRLSSNSLTKPESILEYPMVSTQQTINFAGLGLSFPDYQLFHELQIAEKCKLSTK